MLRVSLVIESRYEAAREVLLDGYSLTVGRTDAASLVIPDEGLSRRHATIHRSDEAVWVLDEGSTNGSFVNGAVVTERGTLLCDGDQISVGNYTTITVRISRPHAPAQRRAAQQAAPAGTAARPAWLSAPYLAVFTAGAIILLTAVVILGIRASGSDGDLVVSEEGLAQAEAGAPAGDIVVTEIYTGDEYVVEETVWPSAAEGEALEVSSPAGPPSAGGRATVSLAAIRQSLSKVMEDRHEPTGQDAAVEVPTELKHYSERGRFLAVQTAEAREQRLRVPHDFAELVALIRDRQLVEVSPVTDSYVIYAVGGGASDEVFAHYDRETGKVLPLFRDAAALEAALRSAPESESLRETVAPFYKDRKALQLMASEYEAITRLARDFEGRAYDLNDAAQRREFKRRMLSFAHPTARRVLEELALAYKSKFNRALPIASLVRTEQYQKELSERNVNAARNSLPPHTTGLAFDISYRYMTAEEQNFLMAEIARLERAGRVEALRENNNCLHVFAFADGRRPPESLIQKSLGG